MDFTRIRTILNHYSKFLQDGGVANPRLCAEVLLANSMGRSREELLLKGGPDPSPEELKSLECLIAKRVQGVPLAYLIGVKEFYSKDFKVWPGVLIPRPDTELVIDTCLELQNKSQAFKFIDVGTGSGNLGITLACLFEKSKGLLIDLNHDALRAAKQNSELHKVAPRVEPIYGDLLGPVQAFKADLLVSNPPYLSLAGMHSLNEEILFYEPKEALLGGPKGTEVLSRLIAEASQIMQSNSLIVLEVGDEQAEYASSLLTNSGWIEIKVHQDLSFRNRVVSARKCG